MYAVKFLTIILLMTILGACTVSQNVSDLEPAIVAVTAVPTRTARPTITAAIQPTATHTAVAAPTLAPSVSLEGDQFTPQQLTRSYTWNAWPVLLRLDTNNCIDACVGDTFSKPPDVILYADGQLIIDGLKQRQMSRAEICTLMNMIEQFGFWDYDPTEYEEQNKLYPRLASPIWIEVNGWKRTQVNAFGLTDFLGSGYLAGNVEVSSALTNTYTLLQQLKTGDFLAYSPEYLAVYILEVPEDDYGYILDGSSDYGNWPLEEIMLKELAQGSGEKIVNGVLADSIYDLFGRSSKPDLRLYTEDDQRFVIAIRALLPYELSGGSVYEKPEIPSPDLSFGSTTLTCRPEDMLMFPFIWASTPFPEDKSILP